MSGKKLSDKFHFFTSTKIAKVTEENFIKNEKKKAAIVSYVKNSMKKSNNFKISSSPRHKRFKCQKNESINKVFCDDADISWSSSDNEETDTKMTLNQPVEISDISSDEEHWHNLQRKKHNSPKRFKQKFIPKKLNFGKRKDLVKTDTKCVGNFSNFQFQTSFMMKCDKNETSDILEYKDDESLLSKVDEDWSNSSDDNINENSSKPGTSASLWIENLVDKLDSEETKFNNHKNVSAESVINNIPDSTKKSKFKKGGFACRLQDLIRQEKSDCILFRHNINKLQDHQKQDKQLQMLILSIHREGNLLVTECKIIEKGDRVKGLEHNNFVTLLLQHHIAVEHKLQLSTVFTLYPPWKKIVLKDHEFPLLLCVSNITNDTKMNESTVKKNNLMAGELVSETVTNKVTHCESLLEALENCDVTKQGVNIAATVQRTYKEPNSDKNRWLLLCEDAFGIFFELSVEIDEEEEMWKHLLQHGEGQRIHFERIRVSGRTTKNKNARLFELIASVWNVDGFGLHQVRNSQSTQDSESQESSLMLPTPSFAYKLSVNRCASWHSMTDHVISLLNRPLLTGSKFEQNTDVDVLYKFPNVVSKYYSASRNVCGTSYKRVSFIGKLVHVNPKINNISLENRENKVLLFINISNEAIVVSNCHNINLQVDDIVLVKDARKFADDVSCDLYTRFILLRRRNKITKLSFIYKRITEKINLCEFEKLFLNSQHLQFLHNVPKISKLLNIKKLQT